MLSLKVPGYLAQGAGGGLAQPTLAPVKGRVNFEPLQQAEVLQPKLMPQDQERAAYVIS